MDSIVDQQLRTNNQGLINLGNLAYVRQIIGRSGGNEEIWWIDNYRE